MEFCVKKATLSDMASLLDVINKSFVTQKWSKPPRIKLETLKADMEDPNVTMLKCINSSSGEIVGCIQARMHKKYPLSIYSEILCVLPNFQRKGIGPMLAEASDNLARELGCNSNIVSVVSKDYGLLEWYEKMGFRKTGNLVPIPPPEERDWVLNDEEFDLVEMEKLV